MATIRLKLRSQPPENELFEVRGAVEGNPTGISNLVAIVVKDEPLPIEGLPDGPLPTFTATILGVPLPPEFVTPGTLSTLTAEVRDQTGDLVDEEYLLANWAWAIVSDEGGGASFAGDDLTVGAAGTLVFSATHNETGATAQATLEVVGTIVFTAALRGLPAEVVEEETYPLTAEVLAFDGSVQETYDPADWTFSIEAGGTFATLTGVDGDVLSINAASAGNSVTVRATYTGGLNVDPAFVDGVTNIIVAPSGDFPETLEPAGMTVILANEGDTKAFGAGWSPQLDWADNAKLEVVADIDSKYGNALQRNTVIGDSGWLDAYNRGDFVANHREMYIRYVFRFAPNWQRGGEEVLFRYGRKVAGSSLPQFRLAIRQGSPVIRWSSLLTGADVGDSAFTGTFSVNAPNIPVFALDVYHTVEVLHRLNSDGNADGYLRVAINGIEITSWDRQGGAMGVDLRSGAEWAALGGSWTALRLTSAQVFQDWGSGTKSVNDWVRMSELYISGRND